MLNNLIYLEVPRPTGYAHHTLKSSGLSLVPKAFGTSSCILWINNPALYPVVKQIFLFRITVPHSIEGGMTYPANHANFVHLINISGYDGKINHKSKQKHKLL